MQAEGDLHYTAGASAAAAAEGEFASWHCDGAACRITTSRFGLHPLFYCGSRGKFAISDSLAALLPHAGSAAVDDDAIAVFLRLGFFLDDDTAFREIRAVPPAADWRFDRTGLVRGVRKFGAGERCAGTREQRLDDYADLFRQSIARRPADGDVVLPLSGGRDSRHILFELLASGAARRARSFRCATSEFPPTRSNEDLRIAALLCHELELPHRVIRQAPSFLTASLRKNSLTSFGSDEHTWALPLCEWMNEQRAVVYDGIAGDVLSAGLFSSEPRLQMLRAERAEDFALDLFGHVEHELRRWLRPEALARFSRDRAIARTTDAVRSHCQKANPVASFFFHNRTRREVALHSCCMYWGEEPVHYPYLDHALYDYLASIPGEDLNDKRFHTDAIARAYPQWARFPYGVGDGEPDAVRMPVLRRRRWNTQLAFEAAAYLLRHRGGWIDEAVVVPRLMKLVGAADTASGFWFNIERIIWAAQLDAELVRGHRPRGEPATRGHSGPLEAEARGESAASGIS